MSVINMKPYVADILKKTSGLKEFGTKYPAKWEVFPIAIYRTVQTPHFVDGEGNELQTKWQIVIELYTDTGSLTKISDDIVAKFNAIGFKGKGQDSNTGNLNRRVCEFNAIVCNTTRMVFTNKGG